MADDSIVMTDKLRAELAGITSTQRAAVLMLLLGEEQAAEIIKFLSPKEVQALGAAMVQVANFSQEAVNYVLDEFVDHLKNQTTSALAVQTTLKKSCALLWATTRRLRCWVASCQDKVPKVWIFCRGWMPVVLPT